MLESKFWREYIDPFIKRWVLSPFSNFVTKAFLYTGIALVAAPVLEHLLLKVVLKELFNVDFPIDVPDVPAYIAGVVLMALGGLYHLAITYQTNMSGKIDQAVKYKKEEREKPHDQEIIKSLLSLLPYENTNHWTELAATSGMRRDFSRNLEECEKFITPPYKLYDCVVEDKKKELVESIKAFNESCFDSGYLGAHEDTSGEMYWPPYHWKDLSEKSKDKYYELHHKVSDSGIDLRGQYNEFIKAVKAQGFLIGEI